MRAATELQEAARLARMQNQPQAPSNDRPGTLEPAQSSENEPGPAITEPGKLLRIASMVRELLEETRQAKPDEAGRARLTQIYDRTVTELKEVLSEDLQEELDSLAPPIEGVPSESEIRIAQAQLVGWLEGLFHGIQAAMFAQLAAARAQFEELRRRGLTGGAPPPGGPGTQEVGQYL
jgi:hypothetical protein